MTNPEEFEISNLEEDGCFIRFKKERESLDLSFRDLDHLKELASQLDDFIKEQMQ